MNYYPNYNNPSSYYMNSYPYNLNNMPYGQQVVQQQTTTNTLNGKIVESEDIVRATEIPMGSYGVFPKADLSEIYIKSWNNNGTTSIVTFKPDAAVAASMLQDTMPNIGMESINLILERLEKLESKLDDVIKPAQVQLQPPAAAFSKKEANTNATTY